MGGQDRLRLSRRAFLGVVAATAVTACSSDGSGEERATEASDGPNLSLAAPPPDLPGDPFTLGVASGDPLPGSVILWTRLAPEPLDPSGGMPDVSVDVEWEVATDEAFAQVAADGVATAIGDLAHSVHVDAEGLEPDTWYWYRFHVGDFTSPVGRTRTFPEPDAEPEHVAFAFISCQSWTDSFWTAFPHLAAEPELDVVFHLGDYIYEGGVGDGVRPHNSDEVVDLGGYRARYGLYKADAGLQAVHARAPFVTIWDDHEVDDDYAGEVPEGDAPVQGEAFLERRAAAYQAYYEHQPVRIDPPDGGELEIYRVADYGRLARFYALDTRQHRDDQPCGDATLAPCDEVDDPDRTMLGAEQEAWLDERLGESEATWNVLAQSVVMTSLTFGDGEAPLVNTDQWDGYRAARTRLIESLVDNDVANPIVISGDIHLAGVGIIPEGGTDPEEPAVAVELVGTSIGSVFPAEHLDLVETATAQLPQIRYVNASQRGYTLVQVTPDELVADYRMVVTSQQLESPITTDATFVVEAGTSEVTRA